MSLQCRFHEHQPKESQPGDMWYATEMVEGDQAHLYRANYLAPEYFERWAATRPPIMVVLPNRHWFCVDQLPSRGGSGWAVTGSPPNITVHPSISNAPGEPRGYHGWLQNGVLSDDVDGRKF